MSRSAYLLIPRALSLCGVEFRTKANTTARDRAHVETEVLEWIERYLQIELILELDSAQWQCPVAESPQAARCRRSRETRRRSPRRMETRSRSHSQYDRASGREGPQGPDRPLPAARFRLHLSGEAADDQPDLPVIVVNNQFSLERRRLTLAHELAHRLIDTDSLSDKDEEKAATLFAGAFLMPREHLLREVGKHRSALGYKEIIDLKRLYRVSGAALLMRLRQLDVISESTLIYAFQTIARGWRTQEPEELEPRGHARAARTCASL